MLLLYTAMMRFRCLGLSKIRIFLATTAASLFAFASLSMLALP